MENIDWKGTYHEDEHEKIVSNIFEPIYRERKKAAKPKKYEAPKLEEMLKIENFFTSQTQQQRELLKINEVQRKQLEDEIYFVDKAWTIEKFNDRVNLLLT